MPSRRTFAGLAAAAAVFGLSACAGMLGWEPASRASLLSQAPPPRERACRVADLPAELPDAGALVDAVAFDSAATHLWRAAGRPAGYVLLSMRYDRDGLNVHRAVIEHTLPPALADTLQKLVFAYRQAVEPARVEWGVRLRVDLGEQPVLRVGRREVCSAAPRDRSLRNAHTGWMDVRNDMPEYTPDFATVWVRVRLNSDGFVTDARVERSLTRGPWEQRLLQYVRTLAFVPAMEDGYPVPGETSLRFRIPQ